MITDAEIHNLFKNVKETSAKGVGFGWTHTYPNGDKVTLRYNRSSGKYKINTNAHWMEYKHMVSIIRENHK